jgi:general secretion pathway protein L
MGLLLGIDIGQHSVRAALLRTGYRRIALESIAEQDLADHASAADALKAAAQGLGARTEAVATMLDGDHVFAHRLELPVTALRQLAEVLPFELEARLPFELDQMVFDSRMLARDGPSAPLGVLAVAARTAEVRDRIDLVRGALGVEPERVEPGAAPLANLALVVPEIAAAGPVVVVHLDARLTDVLVMRSGQPELLRTLSGGTEGLPASAAPLARDLRQTVLAWRAAGGEPPTAVYLLGPGVAVSGAEAYLSAELGIPVQPLPAIRVDGVGPDGATRLVRCARAVALALGTGPRPRGMNLRRGSLAFERGYGFLRAKVPLLVGLVALIVVSFVFATWAELRSLGRAREAQEEALAAVTKTVLGESTRDPEKALEMVGGGRAGSDDDPMPHMDGFDILVQLSKAVPPDVKHDVEEFDYQRGHCTIHGIVPTIPDAQQLAAVLKSAPCFRNVKIVRTNQAVNETRQKYVLELDVKCAGEGDKDKKAPPPGEAASAEAPAKGAEGK